MGYGVRDVYTMLANSINGSPSTGFLKAWPVLMTVSMYLALENVLDRCRDIGLCVAVYQGYGTHQYS